MKYLATAATNSQGPRPSVIGDVLMLDASADVITLKPAKAKPHYRLADLMAECDLNAPEPAELAKWNAMHPAGREA
jgi:antitoxin ChpS